MKGVHLEVTVVREGRTVGVSFTFETEAETDAMQALLDTQLREGGLRLSFGHKPIYQHLTRQ